MFSKKIIAGYWRYVLLIVLVFVSLGGLLAVDPIRQDVSYHAFADTRLFAAAGAYSLYLMLSRRQRPSLLMPQFFIFLAVKPVNFTARKMCIYRHSRKTSIQFYGRVYKMG